jgi:predicted dienelactone hydrolase
LDDTNRPNWDGNGPRPLTWSAWYPAADGASEQALFEDPRSESWFAFGPAARNAPVDPTRRYPLVLLTHGTGGAGLQQEWLARDLAVRGFIAVAADHHGNSNTEPYRAEGFLCWWERVRDLTVLLDDLATRGEFAARIDIDRVFVVGYSLGGCTAAALIGAITGASRFQSGPGNREQARGPKEFPDLADHLPGLQASSAVFRESWARMSDDYRDPRFKAALLLAPGRSVQGFTETSLAAIEMPTRILVGGSDFLRPVAQWLHQRIRSSSLDILAPKAAHYAFLPEATEAGRSAAPDYCIDAPGVDRRAIHRQTAAIAAELFQPA